MNNQDLKPIILQYQSHSASGIEQIFTQFSRLIYYYANRIGDEDASQELTLFLLELLKSMDVAQFETNKTDSLQRYISVSIRNKYIALAVEYQKRDALTAELDEFTGSERINCDDRIEILSGLSAIHSKQRAVIILRYYYGYSDAEIAKYMNISRQAVGKLRNKGLQHLKVILSEK